MKVGERERFKRVLLWTLGIVAASVIFRKMAAPEATAPADAAQTGPGFLDSISTQVLNFMTGNKYTDFITKMKPIAEALRQQMGIAALITITQAAHESAWGLSELTTTANNLYGFTANGSWMTEKRPVVYRNSNEHSTKPPDQIQFWNVNGDIISKDPDGKGGTNLVVKIPFRAYASWLESALDWARLIGSSTRYQTAFSLAKTGNLEAFATAILAAGYATDPAYADKIVAVGKKVEAVWTA